MKQCSLILQKCFPKALVVKETRIKRETSLESGSVKVKLIVNKLASASNTTSNGLIAWDDVISEDTKIQDCNSLLPTYSSVQPGQYMIKNSEIKAQFGVAYEVSQSFSVTVKHLC